MKYKKKNQPFIRCDVSIEEVAITKLLEGILDKTSPELAILYKMINENDMVAFFKRLEEMKISENQLSQLRQKYIHNGGDFQYHQQLKIWLMDYFEKNNKTARNRIYKSNFFKL